MPLVLSASARLESRRERVYRAKWNWKTRSQPETKPATLLQEQTFTENWRSPALVPEDFRGRSQLA